MNIKKVLLASLAGAAVAFVWTMISWMALPWHDLDFRSFADPTPVTESVMNQTTDSGIYLLPNADPEAHNDPEKHEQWMADAAKGPFALMVLRREGMKITMGTQMSTMFLIQLITAFLLTLLLTQTHIESLIKRAVFVCIAALAGGMIVHLTHWSWWGFPIATTVVGIIDTGITWFLSGLAIGKIYKTG